MSLKLAPGREIQEPDDDREGGGCLFSDQLQHPDWPPLGKTQVSALNANQAGPLRPFVRTYHSNNQPMIDGNLHHLAAFFLGGGESCLFPQQARRRANRQPPAHIVSLHTRSCCPRKQQISTWEQSRASQPAPPPPTEAEVTTGEEVQRKDGRLKGFPNRGLGTSRRRLGVPTSRAGACPGETPWLNSCKLL